MTHLAAKEFARQLAGCPPAAREFAHIGAQADRWAGTSYPRALSMVRELLVHKQKDLANQWLTRAEALVEKRDYAKLDELDVLRRMLGQLR